MGSSACDAITVPVTVVIPAWGAYAGEPLERAVRSARHACSQPVRVLVVDNAHGEQIDLQGADVLRSEKRLSLGQARNLGLAAVESEFVLFLDADDELLPGSVDRLVAEFQTCPSTRASQLVAVTSLLADPSTGETYHWPSHAMVRVSNWPWAFRLLESVRAAFPVSGSLIRTAAAASSPGFGPHPDSAEDWVLGVSLAWRGDVRFAAAPAMTYAPTESGQWSRHRAVRAQRAHQFYVRHRISSDEGIPTWVRALVPLLWLAHQVDTARMRLQRH